MCKEFLGEPYLRKQMERVKEGRERHLAGRQGEIWIEGVGRMEV